MIEGARVHPSYKDAQRNGLRPKTCTDCKASTDVTTRQYMACGYEKPIPLATPERPDGARAWVPPSWREQGGELSTCSGYTTDLPAVSEIVQAHPQWKAGTLTAYLDGEEPTRIALDVLNLHDVGIEEWKGEVEKRVHDEAEARRKAGR